METLRRYEILYTETAQFRDSSLALTWSFRLRDAFPEHL